MSEVGKRLIGAAQEALEGRWSKARVGGYWQVEFYVYAFNTEAEADAYQHALLYAFTGMPESAGFAASCRKTFIPADD